MMDDCSLAKTKRLDANEDGETTISRFFRPSKRVHTEVELNSGRKDNNGTISKVPANSEPDIIDLVEDDESGESENHQTGVKRKIHEDSTGAIHAQTSSSINEDDVHVTSREHAQTARTTTTGTSNPFAKLAANPTKTIESSNPFARFALGRITSLPKKSVVPSSTAIPSKRPPVHQSNRSTSKIEDEKPKPSQRKSSAQCEHVKMKDIPEEEQQRIVRKWLGLANYDSPVEDRRFQVLVAARLHARCQEGPTRKAMQALRDIFNNRLTVEAMAQADPEFFIPSINNLQYYSTKAKQIVKAAQEIQSRFKGEVPESEHSLKQLTGIGPVLADLLAFVNTRARHVDHADRQQQEREP